MTGGGGCGGGEEGAGKEDADDGVNHDVDVDSSCGDDDDVKEHSIVAETFGAAMTRGGGRHPREVEGRGMRSKLKFLRKQQRETNKTINANYIAKLLLASSLTISRFSRLCFLRRLHPPYRVSPPPRPSSFDSWFAIAPLTPPPLRAPPPLVLDNYIPLNSTIGGVHYEDLTSTSFERTRGRRHRLKGTICCGQRPLRTQ